MGMCLGLQYGKVPPQTLRGTIRYFKYIKFSKKQQYLTSVRNLVNYQLKVIHSFSIFSCTFLLIKPHLFKAGFSVIALIKSKDHVKTHVGIMNQQSWETLALHNAQHISGHFINISSYNHLTRISREQWKLETQNSVERLKLGLEVGCSCAVNEVCEWTGGNRAQSRILQNSHLRALAKEEGAVVLEENQRGVSVMEVRRQSRRRWSHVERTNCYVS